MVGRNRYVYGGATIAFLTGAWFNYKLGDTPEIPMVLLLNGQKRYCSVY